ncbi:type II toxin-antitoxin system RelE/ParE family toxin [Brenneria tiliae]|uniref:Type II toxin-antitoxin system RelE/ParE family toxin n=1 Tax=Brenneria tiliae TaxID=2914984 RepID=A0ABT0MW41_9GAMM|nr:hypothetical protein [Brenneria tiliae]MCL2894068.1 hypothetical protein [Brenneria tiliae]
MNKMVVLAQSAFDSLREIEFYKSAIIGPQQAAIFVDDLIDRSVASISRSPALYKFNPDLADKGIQVREWLDIHHGYRCFYDDRGPEIEILLYASTRQDFEAALYRHSIIYADSSIE